LGRRTSEGVHVLISYIVLRVYVNDFHNKLDWL